MDKLEYILSRFKDVDTLGMPQSEIIKLYDKFSDDWNSGDESVKQWSALNTIKDKEL